VKHIVSLSILLAAPGTALNADWKIVTRTGDTSIVEYFKGALVRADSLPAFTSVSDFDHRRNVNWRNDLRQYVVVEWSPEPQRDSSSGPVITIEENTTDTGERKQFFGRTARHLVTHMTRSDGPDTLIDGWYVDARGLPQLRASGNAVAVLTSGVGGQKPVVPRIEVKQTGPVPIGLPVRVKTIVTMVLPGGSHQTTETLSEVTELLESTLPDKLFQPPEGYQRVESFPNTPVRGNNQAPQSFREMLEAHWQMIKDWFGGKTDK